MAGLPTRSLTALGATDSAEYQAALTQAQAVFGDEYTEFAAGDVKLLTVISLLLARLVLWLV